MRERCYKERDGPRLFCGLFIDARKVKTRRRRDTHVTALLPYNFYPDRFHHLDEPLHLFDAWHFAQCCRAAIQETRGKERDGAVFRDVGRDRPRERLATRYTIVHQSIIRVLATFKNSCAL